jgi:hypothetical protein
LPVPNRILTRSALNAIDHRQFNRAILYHFAGHCADTNGIFGQNALLHWICFYKLTIILRAEMFVRYARFSFGVRPDPHACGAIGRKYCSSVEALD